MFKIKDVNDVDMAFGGNIKNLLPAYNDIPDEYKGFDLQNKWVEMANDWFFAD